MPDTCLVTFTARDSGFAVLPGQTITFVPTGALLAGQNVNLLARTTLTVVADGSGAGSVALVPGTYRLETMGSDGLIAAPIIVPDVLTATIGECLDALAQASFSQMQVALLAASTGRLFETPALGYASAAVAVGDVFLALNAGVLSVYRKASPTTGTLLGPLFTSGSFGAGLTVNGLITGLAVTQTQTDNTPGRLMKTGDAGWMSNTPPLVPTSIDAVNMPNGLYRTNSTAGSETPGTYPPGLGVGFLASGLLEVLALNGGSIFQRFTSNSTLAVWTRRFLTSSWSAWEAVSPQVYGVGGAPVAAPANIGVTDDSLPRGTWMVVNSATTTTGLPANLATGSLSYLFHHRRVNGGEMQLLLAESATADADRTLWFRRRTASAWGAWKRVYDWGNVLGAVSQSGGVPTGALFERGSNANGEFVRMADGTQICTRTNLSASNANTALGSLFRSADVAWTFPATFAAAPVVTGCTDDADTTMSVSGAPTTTAANVRALAAVTKGAAINIRAQAIGRCPF